MVVKLKSGRTVASPSFGECYAEVSREMEEEI